MSTTNERIFSPSFAAELSQAGFPVADIEDDVRRGRSPAAVVESWGIQRRAIRMFDREKDEDLNIVTTAIKARVSELLQLGRKGLTSEPPENIQVKEIARSSGFSSEKVLRLLMRYLPTVQIQSREYKAQPIIPDLSGRLTLNDARRLGVNPKKSAREARELWYTPRARTVMRAFLDESKIDPRVRAEAIRNARIVFVPVEQMTEVTASPTPKRLEQRKFSRILERKLSTLSFEEIAEIGNALEERGFIQVFQEYGGAVENVSSSFFEGVETVKPELIHLPTLSQRTQQIIGRYRNACSNSEFIQALQDCETTNQLEQKLLSYARSLSPAERNVLLRSFFVWQLGFKEIQKVRPDTQLSPQQEFAYILLLAKNSGNQLATVASLYYALYKSGNPLRSGGQTALDMSELEFTQRLLFPCIVGECLGIRVTWAFINEGDEYSSEVEGVDCNVIRENERRLNEYLACIGGSRYIDIRSMRTDIKNVLGESFGSKYEQAVANTPLQESRAKNFALYFPPAYLRKLGISEEEINATFAAAVSERISPIPARVLALGNEAARKFDALMSLRTVVANQASNVPEFGKGALQTSITRKNTKLVVDTASDFAGASRFPNYGIAVYQKGRYMGVVNAWEIVLNPDIFSAYVADGQVIACELNGEIRV